VKDSGLEVASIRFPIPWNPGITFFVTLFRYDFLLPNLPFFVRFGQTPLAWLEEFAVLFSWSPAFPLWLDTLKVVGNLNTSIFFYHGQFCFDFFFGDASGHRNGDVDTLRTRV
jgi:hypothetical protein